MSKKTMTLIAEKVFEAIPVNRSTSIAELSRDARVSWQTAKNWVELMLWIQSQPKILLVKTSQGVEYKRETLAGRPRKP